MSQDLEEEMIRMDNPRSNRNKKSHDSQSYERRNKKSVRDYDAPPKTPKDRAPSYKEVPPRYKQQEDAILYDDDESEKDEEYIEQKMEYYNQKMKQISNEYKNSDEISPDLKLNLRYNLKISNQKMKILKELLVKIKSKLRPYKPTVERHLRFLIRKYDLLINLQKNLRDPIQAKKVEKKIQVKKIIYRP